MDDRPVPPDQRLGPRPGRLTLLFVGLVGLGLAVAQAVGAGRPGAIPSELPPPGPAAGSPAPDFTLALFDGESFSLSRHLTEDGRPVLLNLWASWCLPCREEMPALNAFARAHPEIQLVGVAIQDTEPEARAFADELAVVYPVGIDREGTIGDAYPSPGLPSTFLIGSDGRIVRQVNGALTGELLEQLIAEL
ncbi:MAG: TlpA family protein disulfide reductase [Acidimicrobiia bacterium]